MLGGWGSRFRVLMFLAAFKLPGLVMLVVGRGRVFVAPEKGKLTLS